jgi:hypothetical protein
MTAVAASHQASRHLSSPRRPTTSRFRTHTPQLMQARELISVAHTAAHVSNDGSAMPDPGHGARVHCFSTSRRAAHVPPPGCGTRDKDSSARLARPGWPQRGKGYADLTGEYRKRVSDAALQALISALAEIVPRMAPGHTRTFANLPCRNVMARRRRLRCARGATCAAGQSERFIFKE